MGDYMGRSVTSMLGELWVIFDSLEGGIKSDISAADDKERRSASIKKRCRLAEELISNLK